MIEKAISYAALTFMLFIAGQTVQSGFQQVVDQAACGLNQNCDQPARGFIDLYE